MKEMIEKQNVIINGLREVSLCFNLARFSTSTKPIFLKMHAL
jgi:hypothetical protein